MIRRLFRLALVIGAAAAVYKVVQARRPSPDLPEGDAWPPTPKPVAKPPTEASPPVEAARPSAPEKAPPAPPTTKAASGPAIAKAPPAAPTAKAAPAPKKAPAKKAADNGAGWIEPVGGTCPTSHPVKGKLTSLIYHLPGMTAYARTVPDRCYRDEDAAQADGLRKAKR
jgi:hypothetical protein